MPKFHGFLGLISPWTTEGEGIKENRGMIEGAGGEILLFPTAEAARPAGAERVVRVISAHPMYARQAGEGL